MMTRTIIAKVLIGASSLFIGLVSTILAQGLQPTNGSFYQNSNGWGVVGGQNAGWISNYDHTGDGGGSVHIWNSDTMIVSPKITMTGIWELHVWCYSSDANGILGIIPWGQTPVATTPLACPSQMWGERIVQGLANGEWQIVFAADANSQYSTGIFFDDIIANQYGGTATPTATFAPQATPTGVSGGAALGKITTTAATPYYSTSGINGVIPYGQSGSGSIQDLNSVEITQKQIGFCLPEEVTRFVSDVNLCFSIPMYEFTAFKVLGINVLPILSIIAIGVFVAFLIRNLQEK
jgi:hypothetical protein